MPPPVSVRALSLLLLSAAALSGCGEDAVGKTSPPPTPVALATATVRAVAVTAQAVGNVEALASVEIKSRVDGQIAQVHVRDGQDVRKGDLLLQIDMRPFEIALQQAEASLARDRALHELALAQEVRYADLLKKGFVTPDQYAQIRGNLDTLAAAVRTGESQVESAHLQLDYTRIRAPIAGRLGRIALREGNLVRAADAAPLTTINQLDPVYVSFSLREQLLPAVRASLARGTTPVEARDPQNDTPAVQGRLSFVDNAVDTATGTIRLRAIFDNPRQLLWPGQFVNVVLQLGEDTDALTVPPVAVLTGPDGPYLYVVGADGKAEQRGIRLARTTSDAAVIESGLKAGERVIVDGQSRVAPGAAVVEQVAANP